jgi:N-methylhydantoinase A
MSKTSGIRVGVDIGGTFTDVALEHPGGRNSAKLLTDYERPERAILAGIAEAAAEAEVELSRIGQVIHGTTLVTNALIQRRGAKTAFITTEGFRDVIEMRSENRFEQYDLNLELPAPLIAREHRYTLSERIAADGSVLLPLDKGAVAALTERIAGVATRRWPLGSCTPMQITYTSVWSKRPCATPPPNSPSRSLRWCRRRCGSCPASTP